MLRQFAPAFGLVLLAACGQSSDEPAAPAETATETPAAADTTAAEPTATEAAAEETPAAAETPVAEAVAAAPAAFNQCKICHSAEPGKNMVGPSLAGVYGTKAGDVAGYTFSTAMKNSGLTWDDATLMKYLEAPQKVVPGTKMAFAGIKDEAKRKEVVEYLKSIK